MNDTLLWILGIGMFLFAIYLWLRIQTVKWAEQNKFFMSPAFGRIKARIRAGKIVQYIANLKGLKVHIDEETGEIFHDKKEKFIWSFWWQFFGVRFIGLDTAHEYSIEVTEVDDKGKEIKKTVTAHSLHFSGSYTIISLENESSEGARIGFVYRVQLETVHAGRCLKFKNNWTEVFRSPTKAVARDFAGCHKVREMLQKQNEFHPETETGFVEVMMTLNNGKVGNPGLIDTLGQKITAINLISIFIEDESIAKALLQKEIAIESGDAKIAEAEKEKQKTIIDADAALYKAEKEALGKKAQGLAENAILEDRARTLGGADGLIAIKKWEAIGGLKELKGTLVFNDGEAGKTPASLLITPSTFSKGEK